MATAVQLRSDHDIHCTLIYGSPVSYNQGLRGKIALFSDSQLVIYCISKGRKHRAFIFKTCISGRDRVPGVFPAVRLLAEAKTKGKITRLTRILSALTRREFDVSNLDEGFFIRINAILDNRIFRIGDALDYLSHAKLKQV